MTDSDFPEDEVGGYQGTDHPEIANQRPSYAVECTANVRESGNSRPEARTATAPRALPDPAAARDPMAPHVLHRDIETRSKIDLKVAGAAKYAADPSTEVLCMAYAVDDEPVQLWVPPDPVPMEFFEAAKNPNWSTFAHNDAFERAIERSILEPRYGFPAIPLERRRCSMAMVYAAALPGSLEKAIEALGLPHEKDKAGQALMRKMAKPAPDGSWIEDAASCERLYLYVRHDVESERVLYRALPSLTADEQRLWELDARINDFGFAVDAELLDAAYKIVVETEAKLQAEFHELTGLDSTNQIAKFIAWLAAHDCVVSDIQKNTLSHALRRKGLDADVRRAIEIRRQLAHASAVKVEALRAWSGADNRVRGTLIFHGASTGRWVGRGPQPQNFKRDGVGMDAKIAAVKNGGAGLESPVEAVGDIARALIVAPPGYRLLIGDFSGIESRVTAWVSGQLSKLDQWAKFDRTGDPKDEPYYINGRACGLGEDKARAIGKTADLAFGYQGGIGAWKKLARDDDTSSDDNIRRYQRSWHTRHPYTVAFWKGIDRNAIAAVRNPGKVFTCKRLSLVRDGNFLRVMLQSGRALSYPFPRIENGGKYNQPRVIFKDASGGKWADCNHGHGAYGGLWTENIVQAISRDLLAAAMLRLETAGYRIVLTVHDEIIAEVADGFGSLEDFKRIITAAPDWIAGGLQLPIAAKVRESQRFSKPDSGEAVVMDKVGILAGEEAPVAPWEDEFEGAEPEPDPDPDMIDALIAAAEAQPDVSDVPSTSERDPGASELSAVFQLLAGIQSLQTAPPIVDINSEGADSELEDHPGGNGHAGGNGASNNGHDRSAGAYPHGEQRTGRHVATYLYRDHLGRNHTRVIKMAATATRRAQYPQSFWVNERWIMKKPKGWVKIPYRLPELLTAISENRVVFIPEGEKDCETLVELGLVATTNSEGATSIDADVSKWTPELNKWFYGAQRVFILEDNDEPGRKFAREKAQALQGIVGEIRIVAFPDVPEGEDVTYWIKELGHSKDELVARCKAAPKWQDSVALERVLANDITMRAIEWLWLNRFAIGKIGVIAGLPDEGKGQTLCYIAAQVTSGGAWPNGEGRSLQGNVIILSAEEDPSDSLVPRLKAAGADLKRVHLLKMVRELDENGQPRKRMFSLVSDLEKLRQTILEVGDVKVVEIDPITAYLGVDVVDSYRDTDVRAVLGPLKELAEELRVAIVVVMHFNKKVDITNALLRISNSLAFVGLPRHVYAVVRDDENERKLFVRAKNNDAAESDNQTLAFRIEVNEVGFDPKLNKQIRAPFIVWEDGYVDVTASEAMQAASENKSPGGRDKAKQFVLDLLIDGSEIPATEIKGAAEANGLSWRTINRAKDELKKDGYDIIVDKDRAARDGKWFWKLSQKGL